MALVDQTDYRRFVAIDMAKGLHRSTRRPHQVLQIRQADGRMLFLVCAANEHRPTLTEGETLVGFVFRSAEEV